MSKITEKTEEFGIRCPVCGADTEVSSTRRGSYKVVRYRRCENPECQHRMTTIERPNVSPKRSDYTSVTNILENSQKALKSTYSPAQPPKNEKVK